MIDFVDKEKKRKRVCVCQGGERGEEYADNWLEPIVGMQASPLPYSRYHGDCLLQA